MTPEILAELKKIETLEGWCSFEKASAMANIILNTKPAVSVELGVFGGRSLIAQGIALKNAGSGVVWGIDPWTKDANVEGELNTANKGWWGSLDIAAIRNGAINAVTQFDLWNWVRVIVARSEHCHELFGPIDVLHIDGNHSETCSTRDANLWLPKVVKGGFVWFDDMDWPETQKARQIVESVCDPVITVGNCQLYRKR